jgi:hypothetical protein
MLKRPDKPPPELLDPSTILEVGTGAMAAISGSDERKQTANKSVNIYVER